MKELVAFWMVSMMSVYIFLRLVRWGEEMLRLSSQIFETALGVLHGIETEQRAKTLSSRLPTNPDNIVYTDAEKIPEGWQYQSYQWKLCADCGGNGADPRGGEYTTCSTCSGAGKIWSKV